MTKIRAAVINTSKEITDVLEEVLSAEGYITSKIYTHNIKRDESLFIDFIEQEKPDVIVYDIAFPYEENYKLFKRLKRNKIVENTPFVLTTTNKKVLEEFVGKTNTHELVGKPYDLEEILNSVRQAISKNNSRNSSVK